MNIAVVLENAKGEQLEREVTQAEADDVDTAAQDVIAGWVLSVGDTIKIVEAP